MLKLILYLFEFFLKYLFLKTIFYHLNLILRNLTTYIIINFIIISIFILILHFLLQVLNFNLSKYSIHLAYLYFQFKIHAFKVKIIFQISFILNLVFRIPFYFYQILTPLFIFLMPKLVLTFVQYYFPVIYLFLLNFPKCH